MMRTFLPLLVPFLAAAPALAAPQSPAAEAGSWSNFRGPEGNGISRTAKPPIEWSEDKNVRWKVALPGLGCSSPIVRGNRVYVTTAIATDRDGQAEPAEAPAGGREGRRGRGNPPSKVHEFVVFAFDRKDGSTVWQTKLAEAVPHEGHHGTASFASSSPVTDGERLWVSFGSRGLYCLDLQGKVLWQQDLGRMRMRNAFGEGSSPALHDNLLVVNCDQEGKSFLAAFDAKSGKERWRTERDERSSWSTPAVVEVGGKPQIVVAATKASRGYDLKTGKLIWQLAGMTDYCVPTPPSADGLVYLMSGYSGAALQAVRLQGATGDLAGSKHVVWEHKKSTGYTPSALLYDGLLYFCRVNSAVLSCLDAKTGAPCFEDVRLQGLREVYASPVGADGRVYITSREGVTRVIAHGREYKELATNTLDDRVDATLALVDDEIFLRGSKTLYCIGEPKK